MYMYMLTLLASFFLPSHLSFICTSNKATSVSSRINERGGFSGCTECEIVSGELVLVHFLVCLFDLACFFLFSFSSLI